MAVITVINTFVKTHRLLTKKGKIYYIYILNLKTGRKSKNAGGDKEKVWLEIEVITKNLMLNKSEKERRGQRSL